MGQVTLEISGAVGILTLDAPTMNAMDRAMVAQLEDLLGQCERDDGVGAVLVRGAGGRAFSAGSDVAELQGLIARGPQALKEKFEQDRRVFGALAHLPKPTIAAIEGAAIGGGLELAVCCDYIVTGRSAKLALPEIKLGVFPGSGGTVRVTRRIGPARATRIMLSGETVATETALSWGLIDELVDDNAVIASALAKAERMASGPALAMQACKEAIAAAANGSEQDALDVADRWAVELGFTEDALEGMKAFAEKRRPVFKRNAVRVNRPG
jgi:enoyl-CoA hydratase